MSVRQTVYEISRRDLFLLASASAATGLMLDFDTLYAQGACDKVDDSADLAKGGAFNPLSFGALAAPLYYWIDGTLGSFESSSIKRARIAAYLDINVGPLSWVDAVLLTDGSNHIIAAQRFSQSDVSVNGKTPYVIFENIALADQSTTYLYFFVRTDKAADKVTVYKHELSPEKLNVSRLDYKHLEPTGNPMLAPLPGVPKNFRLEMLASHGHQFVNDTSQRGALSSPLHGFAFPSFSHPVRSTVVDLSNNNFEIHAFPMHNEQSAVHFMRTIAVLDPVGRVLGMLRREFNSALNGALLETQQIVVRKGLQVQETVANSGTLANHFSQEEKDYYDKTGAPSILDCPYVHIIIDDVAEALGKATIRLR